MHKRDLLRQKAAEIRVEDNNVYLVLLNRLLHQSAATFGLFHVGPRSQADAFDSAGHLIEIILRRIRCQQDDARTYSGKHINKR